MTIAPGDIVRFVNHNDVTHNVTVIGEREKAVDKGLQKPGDTIQHLFGESGKFIVRCSIHPKMKMTVTVR